MILEVGGSQNYEDSSRWKLPEGRVYQTVEEASGQMADRSLPLAPAPKRRRPAMGVWTAITAMLAIAGLQHPEVASGFTAYDFANTTNRMEVYSLPEPAACLTTTLHHSVARTIFGNADRIGTEMECRALHEDEEKGGGYPIAPL